MTDLVGSCDEPAGSSAVLLNARDLHHDGVSAQWGMMESPFVLCEATVTEVCSLARRLARRGQDKVLELGSHVAVDLSFLQANAVDPVVLLTAMHRGVLVFLVEACLTEMSERSQSLSSRVNLRGMN